MAHDIHPDRACGRTGGWRPRRSRPRAQMCFQNTEFVLGYFYRTDLRDWLCRWKEAGTEGPWDGLRTTRQASWSGRRFFYFFRSNPLISLESKKGIQGNASFFPFFSLHFLARDSPAGCISGSRPRAARPASPHDRVVAALSVQPTSEKCGSAPEAASPADGTIAPMIECEAGAGAPANRRGRSNVSPKL
jgi:hypothetical protein